MEDHCVECLFEWILLLVECLFKINMRPWSNLWFSDMHHNNVKSNMKSNTSLLPTLRFQFGFRVIWLNCDYLNIYLFIRMVAPWIKYWKRLEEFPSRYWEKLALRWVCSLLSKAGSKYMLVSAASWIWHSHTTSRLGYGGRINTTRFSPVSFKTQFLYMSSFGISGCRNE